MKHKPKSGNVKKPHASTRRSRGIDYTSTATMRKRHQAKQQQRAAAAHGPYVIGRLALNGSQVHLEALACEPSSRQPRRERFTSNLPEMARWRTRQALHRFMHVQPVANCRLINLNTLLAA